MATTISAADTFNQFRVESESCVARLRSELKQSWESLRGLLGQQAEAFDHASKTGFESVLLADLEKILESHAQQLLIQPAQRYRRERCQQRVSEALSDCDRAMEGVIGAMPEFLNLTASEWLDMVGEGHTSLGSRFRLTWSRKPRQICFRQNLLSGFHHRRAMRLRLEGRLMRLLAECSLEMIVPWQSMLQIWLPQLLSQRGDVSGFHRQAAYFRHRLGAYEKRVAEIMADFNKWSAQFPERIAGHAPFQRRARRKPEDLEKPAAQYFQQREYLERQSRAVDAAIDLEFRLAGAERDIAGKARETLHDIEREHRELLRELGGVVKWLEKRDDHDSSTFPPAVVNIISAANRLNAWTQAVDRALYQVPETVEVTSSLGNKPPRFWSNFRTQTPRSVFRQALQRQDESVVREGLSHLERQHRSMIREIERAREVVAFAAETAQLGKASDLQIEREGIENARSLLEFHRRQAQDIPPEVEKSLVAAMAAGFLRTHTLLESGHFSVARQSVRYGIPGAARKMSVRFAELLREGAKFGTRRGVELYREALIRIGWSPAPTARIPHVVSRVYLSRPGMVFQPAKLPMIYERLFRLDPVEDPRFLIGRQDELNALAEARLLWEHDRESAVVIVGERGSGKTSLLNCAVQTSLAGLDVVRSDFSKRLIRADEMYDFIGQVVKSRPDAVQQTLNSGKRVIILEELERTYLRRVNHYEALRALLNLISKTSRNTLWIISTNYFAFRLLNASLRLDPHFSHRINAMAVDLEHMREAILLRHNLSGLRLRFAPAPTQNPYVEGFKKIAGVEADPEMEFFSALYQESGGVFRTAFALWQQHIDRADAGVLYMRYAGNAQYENIVGCLTDLDLFTLAAILQHGSLTPEEHSIIFRIEEATSNAWLDNLLARGLIQPDPGRTGLRVVPEAGEIVRRALFSRNVA
jgi:hypothetical protein